MNLIFKPEKPSRFFAISLISFVDRARLNFFESRELVVNQGSRSPCMMKTSGSSVELIVVWKTFSAPKAVIAAVAEISFNTDAGARGTSAKSE